MLELVMHRRPLAALTVSGERVLVTPGMLCEFSGAVSSAGVNIFCVSCGEYSFTFYVDEADHAKARAALAGVCEGHPSSCTVSLMKNLGMLTATGREFVDRPGMFAGFIEPVARAGINIFSITTSSDSAIMFVDWDDARKAYAAVEKRFLKGN